MGPLLKDNHGKAVGSLVGNKCRCGKDGVVGSGLGAFVGGKVGLKGRWPCRRRRCRRASWAIGRQGGTVGVLVCPLLKDNHGKAVGSLVGNKCWRGRGWCGVVGSGLEAFVGGKVGLKGRWPCRRRRCRRASWAIGRQGGTVGVLVRPLLKDKSWQSCR